ncbi:MAG: Sortase family protein [Parcubacteria group bacterium ADurb.Bin305]|jgi:sortase (surface protein transpeptidase)|nr:sortase [Candidatus Paceibacterota bacterium]OQA44516.1 MAG: Sortase family protein [Parcubacteria group bacterium ADurb.Bin305]
MKKDFKIFLSIFFAVFIGLFFVLNGAAFMAWIKYKVSEMRGKIVYEVYRKPAFLSSSTSTTLTQGSTVLPTEVSVPPLLPETYTQLTGDVLVIPKLKLEAPIKTVEVPDLKLIEKKLTEGVVIYPGGIPGENYTIILGHSSQYPWQPGHYKSVFSLLNELDQGDEIIVIWKNKVLLFQVQEKRIFLPWPQGEDTTETIFPPEDRPLLILQSCWPVGVAYKRVAVKAGLIDH